MKHCVYIYLNYNWILARPPPQRNRYVFCSFWNSIMELITNFTIFNGKYAYANKINIFENSSCVLHFNALGKPFCSGLATSSRGAIP